MHLKPDQFVDLVEGERSEASFPHLAVCRECRDELTALGGVMTSARQADVPEPALFFFDQLSARVRERVDRDAGQRRWLGWLLRPQVLVPCIAMVPIALLIVATSGRRSDIRHADPINTATSITSTASGGAQTGSESPDAVDVTSDPSLTLVADLSVGMDWDAAADAGFAKPGSAEQAVAHMNAEELRALRRVLQQEMGTPGA